VVDWSQQPRFKRRIGKKALLLQIFTSNENGGWEAKIIDNGDRLRQLNSSQVELVDTTDNFRLGITAPEKLAANQFIDLDATSETYTPIALENKELDGKPVYFLRLKSKSTGLMTPALTPAVSGQARPRVDAIA
jgi:hypothetical protein